MKNKLLLLFVLIATFGYAQNVSIPDANFKAYLVGNTSINTNGDSEIQVSEATAYTSFINCPNLSISDLTGIEAFTNITTLLCGNNSLTNLDVSNNTALEHLDCKDNSIASLDISNNTALRILVSRNNNLTSLDASNNTALTDLDCNNNAITSLNVSNNPTLWYLECQNNALTSLDITNSPDLVNLYCMDNALTSLNVTNQTALQQLRCDGNSITSLDLSNSSVLEELYCEDNALTLLNVDTGSPSNIGVQFKATNNPNLTCIQVHDVAYSTSLWANRIDATASFSTNCNYPCTVNIPDANFKTYLVGNAAINTNGDTEIQCSEATAFTGAIVAASLNISDLTGIEAFTAITELYCNNNQLTSLDVSAITSLEYIICGYNQLTSLDVSSNTALIYIDCQNNQLTSLDVPANTTLTQLKCDDNQISSLDVSANTALNIVECYNNNIVSLDFSTNVALTSLACYGNNLTSLNIANGFNTNLTFLSTGNNPSLTCIQVDANIVGTSPNNWYKDAAASYSDNCTPCTVNIPDANFKAALVGDTAINTNGDTEIQCSEATDAIGTIYAYNDNISDLTGIEAFINITALYCYDNNLTSLDVSANISLIDLFCDNNNLTSLNIANGNNANMINFDATGNAALTCIQVDAGFTPNSAGWQKDVTANYSDNCTPCTVNIPDANFKAYLVGNTAINTNGDTEIQCSEATAFTGTISCSGQSITDLTGIEAFTALTVLYCNYNQLTSLDVSANTALTVLHCRNNQLTSLDVSANTALSDLRFDNNQLTSLDVSANTALITLVGSFNQLTSLDVSANTALENLHLYDNPVTSIDVSANTALIQLELGFNPITSIDVSTNTALQGLYFYDTQITSIDLSNNTALKWVYCENNQLTSLDLSAQPNLIELTCFNNQLTSLNIANGNNANMYYFNALNNTALTCIEVDAAIVGTSPTDWYKDAGATYNVNCGSLSVDDFSLNTVSIYPNPTTSVVNIKMNAVLKQATVYSMLGKQVLKTQNNAINVSGLSNGMYVITIEAENGNVSTKRFIKQ